VHYVVTEYGVAHLHGKTIRERALALINIAHPSYRKELLEFVKGKHYVYADEAVWQQAKNPYPGDWESEETFGDTEFVVRPVRATDERMLQEFFYSHDRYTTYYRYLGTKKQLGHKEAAHMCCVDYADRMAFGVFLRTGAAEKFVAIGRYDLDPRTNHAETAVVVGEEWRRRGIATFLLNRLAEYAESKGIDVLISEILIDNAAMAGLHRKLGNELRRIPGANAYSTLRRLSEEPRKRTSMPPPPPARAAE
jgi:GNAT superfamily N-acetyltransferase